ncbi:MAG: YkgJ family cysteine cluster protein [Bryobacteraceae bacterium]
MVTALEDVKRLAAERRQENLEFRRYLAAHPQGIRQLQILAGDIQKRIDCTACANCCRFSTVPVNAAEIEAIAAYLKEPAADVIRQYTDPDPDSTRTRLLRNTPDACVFLDGNLCLIYEARPKACRDFPHLAIGTHSLGGRVSSLCRWASLCPIIFNALESCKHVLGFPGRHSV